MSFAGFAAGVGLFFFFLVMALALVSIVLGLPGTWIILGEAVIYALITGINGPINWWIILILAAFAGIGELLEFLLTAGGAKKSGGSYKSIAGAIIGGIVGAILLNGFVSVIGALAGAFLGVYLGALLVTWLFERDWAVARETAMGALRGRLGAVFIKGALGVAMASIIIWRIAS